MCVLSDKPVGIYMYGGNVGDNLNFDMGEEFLDEEGIKTVHVRVWDDVASATKDRIEPERDCG